MIPIHQLRDVLDRQPSGIRPLDSGAFARATPGAVKLAADPGTMTLLAVISTSDRDRAGDVVVSGGLGNAEEFMKNPVVLWAHNRYTLPPIGTCLRLDVQPDRVVAETRFAQGVALAEDLFRLYDQGVLRGWSIGFVPRKASLLPDSDGAAGGARRGLLVEEWDLLEYSAVPVPENPGALTLAIQKGIVHDGLLRDWLSRVPDDPGGRWWRGSWDGKAGHVLARRNEERIRDTCQRLGEAGDLLQQVLAELEGPASADPAPGPSRGLLADLVCGAD
jgi:Caudovirus prohead serine protease